MFNSQDETLLKRFQRPYQWDRVDATILDDGGVILEGFIDAAMVDRLNMEFNAYIASSSPRMPNSGSTGFDEFLGYKTLRVQNLLNTIPSGAEVVGNKEVVSWSNRTFAPISTSCILNSAELIQINPGEQQQRLHRDTNQWPDVFATECPILTNAIIALDPFNYENGATRVVPRSAQWDSAREPQDDEMTCALMNPGDALLIRGDTLHGGGANRSDRPRRAISLSYCLGWLRPIENNLLNISLDEAATLCPTLQQVLGFSLYDGGALGTSILGVFNNYLTPNKLLDEET